MLDLSDVLTSVNVTTATGRTYIYSKQKGDAGSQCCSKSKTYINCKQCHVNVTWI